MSLTLLSIIASIATTATANQIVPVPGGGLVIDAPTPTAAAVHRRADFDRECFSSVVDELSEPSADPELSSWAVGLGSHATDAAEGCAITVPSSLEEEYLDYYSTHLSWIATLPDKIDGIHTKCGAKELSLSFTSACSDSYTVVFTAEATASAAASTTTLPPPDEPLPSVIYIDAGEMQRPPLAPVVALAVFLGAIVAL